MLFPDGALKAYSQPAPSESSNVRDVFHPAGGAGLVHRQLPSETMLVAATADNAVRSAMPAMTVITTFDQTQFLSLRARTIGLRGMLEYLGFHRPTQELSARK